MQLDKPTASGSAFICGIERQTFRRLPETRAVVFGIRTLVTPLARAIDSAAAAEALIQRLHELPDPIQRYKNLDGCKARPCSLSWKAGARHYVMTLRDLVTRALASMKSSATAGPAAAEITEWLLGSEVRGLPNGPAVLKALGLRLNEMGLPLSRASFHVRTLHPQLFGIGYLLVSWPGRDPQLPGATTASATPTSISAAPCA